MKNLVIAQSPQLMKPLLLMMELLSLPMTNKIQLIPEILQVAEQTISTDTTTTTQTSDVTIVSAGASAGMSTGKKVMVVSIIVGVIGGAVYYRSKKM